MIEIRFSGENNQEVSSTNIWELAKQGSFGDSFIQCNINSRILHVFVWKHSVLMEIQTGKNAVMNFNPKAMDFEIVFEDGTHSPFFIYSKIGGINFLPTQQKIEDLVLKVWMQDSNGKPFNVHKIPLMIRKVSKIPYIDRK